MSMEETAFRVQMSMERTAFPGIS